MGSVDLTTQCDVGLLVEISLTVKLRLSMGIKLLNISVRLHKNKERDLNIGTDFKRTFYHWNLLLNEQICALLMWYSIIRMHSYSTYSLFIRDPHCNALSSSSPPSASFLFSGATVRSIQPFPPALSIKRFLRLLLHFGEITLQRALWFIKWNHKSFLVAKACRRLLCSVAVDRENWLCGWNGCYTTCHLCNLMLALVSDGEEQLWCFILN